MSNVLTVPLNEEPSFRRQPPFLLLNEVGIVDSDMKLNIESSFHWQPKREAFFPTRFSLNEGFGLKELLTRLTQPFTS